jgi:SSS family solute:Na+ symporter
MTPILQVAATSMGAMDWGVIGGYLLVMLASGVWFARREPSGAGEYFLANRRMPAWAVSFSVIASALSVATFIGVPESVFKGNMTYLSTTIGSVIAVAVVAGFFIPAFYKANVTTVYGLLERRFGEETKKSASGVFMVGRLFASGARVFIGAIPLSMVMFGAEGADEPWRLMVAIGLLSLVAVVYTLIGGIASVIWTDVIQTLVLVSAAVAAVLVLLHKIPLPLEDIWGLLRMQDPNGNSKTTVLLLGLNQHEPNLGFNPNQTFTLLTAVCGFSLINMAAYGTDHDLAQRMLTCKSAVRGSRSAWGAILASVPITMVFMVIGALLWVYYGTGNGTKLVAGQQVFPAFILNEMPAGLKGLMLAGLFAAGLGSLNSAINAMAATFVSDFYMARVTGKSEKHYLVVSRLATVGWGVMIAGFAVVCIFWKRANPDTTLIDFALKVMMYAYAGLLAVFLTAIFTRRGNRASAAAALGVGFLVIFVLDAWPTVAGWAGTRLDVALPVLPVKMAYPWQMLIATGLAFGVCCAGRARDGQAGAESTTESRAG